MKSKYSKQVKKINELYENIFNSIEDNILLNREHKIKLKYFAKKQQHHLLEMIVSYCKLEEFESEQILEREYL